MNIFEIFNTSVDVSWTDIGGHYAGFFNLDDDKFLISIDTFTSHNKIIAELSFSKNGSMDFSGDDQPSAKIFGALLNSISNKLNEINPDILCITVQPRFGAVESRKRFYSFLVRRFANKNQVKYQSGWIKFSEGWVLVIGRNYVPSKSEEKDYIQLITNK